MGNDRKEKRSIIHIIPLKSEGNSPLATTIRNSVSVIVCYRFVSLNLCLNPKTKTCNLCWNHNLIQENYHHHLALNKQGTG